ncbi:MAG: zf-HC2 domain-containing protein [Syntrophomonadaceae bacterium]|nr:zf-HC2 domain-containing protein [Syntrophomonadaceae bacterium]
MNCQQIDRLILQYCDNTLPPELRTEFIQHLKECSSCKNTLKLTLMENEALKSNDDIPSLPDDFTPQIMGIIQQHQDVLVEPVNHKPEGSKAAYYKRGLVISSAVLVAALALFLILPGRYTMPGHVDIAENDGVPQQITIEEENNTQADKEKANSGISGMADGTKSEVLDSVNAPANPAKHLPTAKRDLSEDQGNQSRMKPSPARVSIEDELQLEAGSKQLTPNNDHLYLQPVNLPQSYKLAQIISDAHDNLTFVYESSATNKKLKIHLSPIDLSESGERVVMLGKKAEEKTLMPQAEIYADTAQTVEEDKKYNSYNADAATNIAICKNDLRYNVTLIGTMSQQELLEIASLIDFKEGNFSDTKD